MDSELAIAVTRLAGYLSGVVAVDGDIRQYTAGAYVTPGKRSSEAPEAMIRDFYSGQTDFRFSSSEKLERGLVDLDRQLGGYLIRRPWGLNEQTGIQHLIDDRRKFLTLRIMDMIADIAPEVRNLHSVYKLETGVSDSRSQVTFFCVQIDAGFLVLQFNDDLPFIRTQETQ